MSALDVVSTRGDRGAIGVPVLVIRPSRGIGFPDLRSLWHHRELLYFLVWRDVMVRYKQTVIGASWAILQPALTMAIFAVVFGHFARIPSDGVPYPIFAYAALLPWTYFSQAVTRSAGSLVGNAGLITKVYFPRMIIPLASVAAPAVDFALAFMLCGGLMRWYHVGLRWSIVTLPLFFVLMVAAALAVGLWLAPLNAKYRDIGHTIPFLTQVWLYASPVAYSLSLVPEQWRMLYGLNPMVGVIEGFRWALLGRDDPDLAVIAVGASVVLVLLLGGLVNFRRMERHFADVV